MNRLIPLKQTTPTFVIAVLIVCLGPLPKTQAVSPPPDGGYPNFTTAEGQNALLHLTTGIANTAVGALSLISDTTGNYSVAVGGGALVLNNADSNTAVGALALLSNTTGSSNTAAGFEALENATGDFVAFNTAVGFQALQQTTANANVAVGDLALQVDSSGNFNTAIGAVAGSNQTTGSGNVYIGQGIEGVAGENNQTYIKNINTTSVSGGGADFVTVNLNTGLLGHLSSSRRYKEDIKPMDNASETLYRLKPVTYRYKKEIDPTQLPAFGLIAEDVAEVNPNLIARNVHGQPESVHYEMVNTMLLNEFQKEHRTVQEQDARLTKQEALIACQQKQIEALTAGLQKVSAQLEVSKTKPQTALNNQ